MSTIAAMVEEDDNYAIVSGQNPGIWQAGSTNLPEYNTILTKRRFWLNVPVIGWATDAPREGLKLVKVAPED